MSSGVLAAAGWTGRTDDGGDRSGRHLSVSRSRDYGQIVLKRGSFEEGRPALVPGTFSNGFHEIWPIAHAEGAPALARTGQTIVNVPDTTILKLYVDDEPFYLPRSRSSSRRHDPDAERNDRSAAPVPRLCPVARQKSLVVSASGHPVAQQC